MLRGEFESAGEMDHEQLREAYDDLLAETITSVGVETVAEQSGVDRSTLDAVVSGDRPELTLEETASILATDETRPGAESIAAESRDILLMGMTTAVLDVEALASNIDGKLEPKEIQQKVEGRFPITLDEYALLHATIEGRSP